MAKCLGAAREQPCQTSVYHRAFPQAPTSPQRLRRFFSSFFFPAEKCLFFFLQGWKNVSRSLRGQITVELTFPCTMLHRTGCVHVTWWFLGRPAVGPVCSILVCKRKSDALYQGQSVSSRSLVDPTDLNGSLGSSTLAGWDQSKWIPCGIRRSKLHVVVFWMDADQLASGPISLGWMD